MSSKYGSTSQSGQWAGGARRPSQPAIAASVSRIMYKNAVYYSTRRYYRGDTPAKMNYKCIDHVFYAFAHVTRDGIVYFSDEWADLSAPVDGMSGCVGSFMHLKQLHPHLKVILSIGGGDDSQNFATVAASAATRDNFGSSALGLIQASGFDGIDIDWEHPSDSSQGRHFLSLLAAVRLYLPEGSYVLTAALPAGSWALRHIDLEAARHYLDFINLMAYDFTGPWSHKTGHHAQLYPAHRNEPSGAAAVEYVISTGFPSTKILLGIPAYGRSFLGAERPGQRFDGHGGEDGTFEFKALPRPDTDEIINTAMVAAYCSGGDGGFVSYDNAETVKAKAEYCKRKKLGGLFYWTGTGDVTTVEPRSPVGRRSPRGLIAAGFKTLHNA